MVNLNLKERLKTFEFLAILYIFLLAVLVRIITIPEMLKGFLVVPATLVFFYLFGHAVYIFILKFDKSDHLNFKSLDTISRAIITSWFGFFVWVFIIATISLLDFIVFRLFYFITIQTLIMRFIGIYAIIFIFLILLFEKSSPNNQEKIQTNKKISSLPIFLLFVAFSIIIVLIAKQYTPFPFFNYGFASPSLNYNLATIWSNTGYFNINRILEVTLSYLGSLLYNLDPLAYLWIVPFFVYFIVLVGSYIFVYSFSNNKCLSLITALICVLFFGVTSEWGGSILGGFKGNYFLGGILPYTLFFIYKNFKKEEKITKKDFYLVIIITLSLAISLFSIIFSSFVKNTLYLQIQSFLFRFILVTLILLFLGLFFKKYKNSENRAIYILIILSLSSYFFHNTEFEIFIILTVLYFFSLKIVTRGNNGKWFSILLVFILLTTISTLIFLVYKPQNLSELKFIIGANYASDYDVTWKINMLKAYSQGSPIIWSLAILSYVLLFIRLNNNKDKIPIMFLFSVIFFIYFFPVGISYRIEKFSGPFISFLIVFFILFISNLYTINKTKSRQFLGIFLLIILFLFIFIHSITPIYKNSLSLNNLPTKTLLSDYEYNACLWMRENLSENTVILTDWQSHYVMTYLCEKSKAIYPTMDLNLSGFPESEKTKYMKSKEIFELKNGNEVYSKISELKSFINLNTHIYYIEKMSIKHFEFRNYKFIIVLTNRAIKWLDTPAKKGEIISPMNSFYSTEKIDPNSKYLRLFSNETYFTLIYNDTDYIYIFGVNPEPGVPFQLVNKSEEAPKEPWYKRIFKT